MAAVPIPESHRDLLSAPVGVLATNGRDGFPQVTAIWFLATEDDAIVLTLNVARQKTRNLRRSQECSFLIVDPASPYRTLEIRARAEIADDPDYAVADRVLAKYGRPFDPRTMDGPGGKRVAVTLRALKVNVWGSAS